MLRLHAGVDETDAGVRHALPHKARARHFAHEIELGILPAERERQMRAERQRSVMLDERSGHSYVQEKSALAIQSGENRAR